MNRPAQNQENAIPHDNVKRFVYNYLDQYLASYELVQQFDPPSELELKALQASLRAHFAMCIQQFFKLYGAQENSAEERQESWSSLQAERYVQHDKSGDKLTFYQAADATHFGVSRLHRYSQMLSMPPAYTTHSGLLELRHKLGEFILLNDPPVNN